MTRGTRWLALAGAALLLACGDDATSPAAGSIVGTWELVSVNGVGVPAGTLRWTFSGTTLTATSDDDDCTQTGSYSRSGDRLTVTITQQFGPACGDEIGDVFEFTIQVDGNTLIAVVQDPELGTGTFEFRRA